jgi:autotransporter-associated beta strand protein
MTQKSSSQLGLFIACTLALAFHARAASATWNLDPTSPDWNTAANWTPATVPNGPTDVATFGSSNHGFVSTSANTTVNSIVFDPGTSIFTVSAAATARFTIRGGKVVNNSGVTQFLVNEVDNSFNFSTLTLAEGATLGSLITVTNKGASRLNGNGAQINFTNNSSAGNAMIVNLLPTGYEGAKIDFYNSSTAGTGTFVNQGSAGQAYGGRISFHDNSTAGRATFDLQGAVYYFSNGGIMNFYDTSTAGRATFAVDGAAADLGAPGTISFYNNSTAAHGFFTVNGGAYESLSGGNNGGVINLNVGTSVGSATFIVNGGTVAGADGGVVSAIGADPGTGATYIANGAEVSGAHGAVIFPAALTAQTLIVVNDGANGGEPGIVYFYGTDPGGPGRVQVFGNGQLDISRLTIDAGSVGSIEGNGKILLGSKNLSVGSNNVKTRFAGMLRDGGYGQGTGGSLTKVGTGQLTLLHSSSYSGPTTISEGQLIVGNKRGSATGTGDIFVQAGGLGGAGTVAGAVTVGTGSGAGADLSPAQPGALIIQKSLTFQADGTYHTAVDSDSGGVAQVSASGVTIESEAEIAITDLGTTVLTPGTVFTVLNNTAATSVAGAFANLPDGSTITVGSNTFQANYEGGDGNDLTLTVVSNYLRETTEAKS